MFRSQSIWNRLASVEGFIDRDQEN